MFEFDRITFDPEVMGGPACIRGTRVSVKFILNLFASGMSIEEILIEYPHLECEDIHQTLRYPAWLANESDNPLEPLAA